MLLSYSTCLLLVAALATPQASPPVVAGDEAFFYHGLEYGSQSQFNPATVLVNGSFDILRNISYTSSPFEVDYRTGFANLADNLIHPWRVARDGQFGRFIAHEVVPYRGLEARYGHWVPNLTLHLLGESMVYRGLSEWYAARGAAWPRLWGMLSVVAAQLTNEAVENGSYRGVNMDPLADVFIYNILGLVLFSFDEVARFFSGPATIAYWPGQAALDLRSGVLFNHGENYAFKISLGSWTRLRLFAYFGQEGLFGLSLPLGGGHTVSCGVGPRLLELEEDIAPGPRVLVPKQGLFNVDAAIFWDRHESLMASLLVGGPEDFIVRLNIYPGVLQFGEYTVGLYVLSGAYEGLAGGLTFRYVPVMPGLLFRRDRSREVF